MCRHPCSAQGGPSPCEMEELSEKQACQQFIPNSLLLANLPQTLGSSREVVLVLMLIQETTGETTGGGAAQNAVEAAFPTFTVAILVIVLLVLILVAIVAFFVAVRSSNLANLMEHG